MTLKMINIQKSRKTPLKTRFIRMKLIADSHITHVPSNSRCQKEVVADVAL